MIARRKDCDGSLWPLMLRYQKNFAQFFLSKRWAPRDAIPFFLVGTAVVASCSHDWNSYDPGVDEGSSSSISSSSGMGGGSSSSSTSTAGAGGTGGAGGMSVGGMGGAGGGALCVPDMGKACYSGPTGTQNIGACKGGATLCQPDGMSYGPCLGQVTPVIEECSTSAVDDDCNGAVNEHCGLWAVRAGTALEQRTNGVATDSAGNVVITGYMLGSADFGGGVLTSAGGYDIFVAKFDKDGKHVWSKLFGGATDDQGLAIAVDSGGHSLVTGYFTGSMAIDGVDVLAVDSQDAIVIAIEPTGAILGYLAMGGMADQRGNAITIDSADNLIVTGTFATEIDTGMGKLTSAASLDGFLVKFDNMGTPLWHKSFGGPGDDEGYALATDAANHVYVTGYFDDTVDFGGGVISDGGSLDVFLAKFDASGNHVLSKGFPSAGDQYADSIAVDATANMYLFGDFDMAVNMGGGSIPAAGGNDLYVTKLDATGKHVFTKTYGDPGEQAARAMTVDKNGDIVFTSEHEGTVDYGGGPITNASGAGSSDVVVVKLKGTTGAHEWSRRFGNQSDQDSRCIATDGMNNIFVGGEFGGSMNFGPVTITSNSSDDAFVVKFPP